MCHRRSTVRVTFRRGGGPCGALLFFNFFPPRPPLTGWSVPIRRPAFFNSHKKEPQPNCPCSFPRRDATRDGVAMPPARPRRPSPRGGSKAQQSRIYSFLGVRQRGAEGGGHWSSSGEVQSRFAKCPVCNAQVPILCVNQHLDSAQCRPAAVRRCRLSTSA